ncbi:TRAP-type C4-dicarboxylate transport system permease small subunit [Geomicrobium halophilum]|uniref:TRAP-type C4-dicarboxylate transport system permease small subunit n=1 Tax=Geomicrobium halophilum TaxID=549000 RepID=A0A841PV09_9BACL|nr:TRAP transporter small permease [Geomicrobium halophilum]MBB6450976.1 TRAP-type C4-dicarboxylate transport system permease small subunit [Geomicrobium halophilum]
MIKKIYDHFEEIIGSSLFVAMLLILIAQTSARQGFGTPLMWSEELSKLLFIYVGYLGIVACIKDDSHVSIDVLINKLPAKAQKWVYTFNQLLILSALVTVFMISIPIVQNQAHLNIVTLQISYMYMYLALPILTLLMIYRLIERLIKEWRKEKTRGVE